MLKKIIFVLVCACFVLFSLLGCCVNSKPTIQTNSSLLRASQEKTVFAESDSWQYKVFNTSVLQDYILDVGWRPQADYCILVGTRYAYAAYDAVAYKIELNDNNIYEIPTGFTYIEYFRAVDWHPTGDYAAVVGSRTWMFLWFFDGTDFEEKYSARDGRYYDVAWHPTGDYALVVGSTIQDYGMVHWYDYYGETMYDITPATMPPLYTVSWQPDGYYALIGGWNTLIEYDPVTGSFTSISQDYTVFDISWHPSGDYALLVGRDSGGNGVVLEHILYSGTVSEIFSTSATLRGISWKPTGNFALICGDGILYEYDGINFRQIFVPSVMHLHKIDWLPPVAITKRYSYAVIGGNISTFISQNGIALKYRQNDAYVDNQLVPVLDFETDAPNRFANAYTITLVSGQFAGFGYVDGDDRADWYKFNVTAGDLITIDLTPPSDADFDIYLYDDTNTLRNSSTNVVGQAEHIEYTADYTGEWYLEVRRFTYDDSGTYSFTISAVAQALGVSLLSPFGGEDWTGDTHHDIEWFIGGGIPPYTVTLKYSTDSGSTYPNLIVELQNVPAGSDSYSWLVPKIDCTTTKVKIEVSDSVGQTADAESFADFEIDSTPPTIVSVLPADTSTDVALDAPITIQFDESMNESSAENAFGIAPDPGGWSWSWNANSDTMTGTHNDFAEHQSYLCTILTSAKDDSEPGNNLQYPYNWQFTTLSTELWVEVKSPNGGETWIVGEVENIEWVATGGVTPIDITILYSTNGSGGQFVEIAANETNDGVYEWTVPDTPSENCFVKIIAADAAGNSVEDISDSNFTIYEFVDNPPDVAVLSPSEGETLINGTEYNIRWSATDDYRLPHMPITIKYSDDNGASWTVIAARTENDGIYEWLVPDVQSTECLINISCVDSANQIGYALSGIFTIHYSNNTPPKVHIISPSKDTVWYIGGKHEIAWNAEDDDLAEKPFNISYSTNGSNWIDIVTDLSNQTSVYEWTVPTVIEPSSNCYIKITAYDSIGQLSAAISDRFTTILLYRIEVKPSPTIIEYGLTQQFYAYGYDINGNKVDINVSWTAEPSEIGVVDAHGLLTAGSTDIEGWVNASVITEGVVKKGCANVTVTGTALNIDKVCIEPQNVILKLNDKVEFFATAYNGTKVLSAVVYNWSLTGNIGDLSATNTMNTTFYARKAGSAEIVVNATYRNITKNASTSIEVRAPIAHIVVQPANAVLIVNQQLQFEATAYDSENNIVPYEVIFEWSVEGEIGKIEDGLFTATQVGTGRVIAKNGSVTGSADVTVIPPDTQPPTIVHTPVQQIVAGASITVKANVTDNVGVKEVKLYFRQSGESNYRTVLMIYKPSEGNYTAVIASEFTVDCEYIEYYIEATDTSNNTARKPSGAPTTVYTVEIRIEKFYFPWFLLIIVIAAICVVAMCAAIIARRKRAKKKAEEIAKITAIPTAPPPVARPVVRPKIAVREKPPAVAVKPKPAPIPAEIKEEKKVVPTEVRKVAEEEIAPPPPPPPEEEIEKKIEEEKKVKKRRKPRKRRRAVKKVEEPKVEEIEKEKKETESF